MLGDLPVVGGALELRPSLLDVPGPHGIPLIARAARVLEYLTAPAERRAGNRR